MGRPKHQDNSQVFDVSKPGRSAPSHTSRPVIMDHRQISEDPMVTGGNDMGLMTHTKPVVPISINSDTDEPSQDEHKTENSQEPYNFFGNTADAPAGEQKYTPPEQTTQPAASPEPYSGFQTSSEPTQEHANKDNKPVESSTEAEAAPLPAELTAPQLDDPVGLSSVNTSVPSSEEHPGNPELNQNTDQAHESKDDNKPAGSDVQQNPTEQLPAVPENIGEIEQLPFPAHAHHGHANRETHKRRWTIPAFIVLLLGVFLALDSGVVGSGKLPFEIIKEKEEAVAEQLPTTTPKVTTPPAQTAAPTTQPGLTQYSLVGTPLSFSYPSSWGKPVITADAGFSKRGGTNKSNGTYTHLIGFETNKDVQLALTSNKYLPATRAVQYYDFLQWCSGTHDAKIYRQKLLFSTTAGVDTPTTITCSDGPVADASKIDELTIVQKNTKDAAGKPAGDIYTKNLSDAEFVVLRVRDTAMTSGESIKTLLASVKLASQSTN